MSKTCTTPSGSSWSNPIYSSTVPSSVKQVGHNVVTLPWLATSTQIQFATLVSSPRVRSTSAMEVTMDTLDMLVGEIRWYTLCKVGDRLEV